MRDPCLLGKGGMGEVYRAHDSRLSRDVAIKVSNAQFTERFTREARTIASLNHTNICHLYDVGPNYLVMEYVEGPDLRGPLDFEDALPIIQQVIDGIEAAHEKNIIHRDLKPANIKITPEGVVKILDFGLAKAMEPPPSSDGNPKNSPTLAMGATVAGPEYQEMSDHPRVGGRNYFFLSVSLVNHSAQRWGGNAKRAINATMNKSTTMRKKRAIWNP